uniref:B-cell receptor-associated protein n=1 Tax=Sphaerodactylus townsendi TaxID=933632 RepID=A0ACB8ELY5_9SAUR
MYVPGKLSGVNQVLIDVGTGYYIKKRWQKIFKSRLVRMLVTYGNTFFVVLIVILVLLFLDAIREIRKYDDVTEKVNLQNNPGAVEHFHMKLFRAQRNLYIAGFALLMSL